MSNWQHDLVSLLFKEKFMALATADRFCRPWISPLVYGCDQQLQFYWASAMDCRHSQNVLSNPYAALAIYDSTQKPNIAIQGFYAEGRVEELGEEQLERATKIFYGWRYPILHIFAEKLRGPKHFLGESPRRIYRLIPEKFYGLDPEGHPIWGSKLDMRVEVSMLEEFKKRYAQDFKHLLQQ